MIRDKDVHDEVSARGRFSPTILRRKPTRFHERDSPMSTPKQESQHTRGPADPPSPGSRRELRAELRCNRYTNRSSHLLFSFSPQQTIPPSLLFTPTTLSIDLPTTPYKTNVRLCNTALDQAPQRHPTLHVYSLLDCTAESSS